MSLYTVFGSTGFIGSEIVSELKKQGHEVQVPSRHDKDICRNKLGTVIYAAGYGDCEKNPSNVVAANLTFLGNIIETSDFDKLVYFSSTRLYLNQSITNESTELKICNNDSRRLFNITKIAAEELCLKSNKNCLIVRPSNVYGLAIESPLFLPTIVKNAILSKNIDMYVTPEYSKDYVFVGDVVKATLDLIDKDIDGIVNIASGENTSAKQIAEIIESQTGCNINWLVDKDLDYFHPIDISKIERFINYKPMNLDNNLHRMILDFKVFFDEKDI